jgi:protein-S-isoprenylcysteine O-methyltransferase Ste14
MASIARQAEQRDTADVIAPPPLIYLAGLVAGFSMEAAMPSASLPAAMRLGLGGALAVVGAALARSFFRALARAGTTISPYSSSSALVTTGPYRFSRNPGYLGMAMAYAGTALLAGALWPFASLVPTLLLIDRGVIRREERYLRRTFGADYANYRARTRRWL